MLLLNMLISCINCKRLVDSDKEKLYETGRYKGVIYYRRCRDCERNRSTVDRKRPKHKLWKKLNGWKYRKKYKEKILENYGKECACCGEKEIKFLSIDHIEGGGNKHRKSIGNRGGNSFYHWLIKNNFPEGYQILCFNCNLAKGFYGECPHKVRH